MNRTPTVLRNTIAQSCNLLIYEIPAPSQMFNVKILDVNFNVILPDVKQNAFYWSYGRVGGTKGA